MTASWHEPPTPDLSAFGARLRHARYIVGDLTLDEMATRIREVDPSIRVSRASWRGWEMGQPCSQKVEVAEAMEKAFEIDKMWVLWGQPPGSVNAPFLPLAHSA